MERSGTEWREVEWRAVLWSEVKYPAGSGVKCVVEESIQCMHLGGVEWCGQGLKNIPGQCLVKLFSGYFYKKN